MLPGQMKLNRTAVRGTPPLIRCSGLDPHWPEMSGFVQGQSVDFASAQSESAVSETSSAAGFFSKAWQVTQKLASDVGVPDVFSDVHKKVNIIKAQQMGNKLELVEKVDQSTSTKCIDSAYRSNSFFVVFTD
jgi:hypothetical protein